MATTTARFPPFFARYVFRPLGALATAAFLALFSLAISIHYPTATPAAALVGVSIFAVAVWMALSQRYEWTLVVLMVYLGCADGYLKLSTGSSSITLTRDILLYSITIGVLARMAIDHRRPTFPPLAGWVFAWLLVVLVQITNPSNGTLMHSLASVRPHAEFVPLFFLAYFVMRSKRRIRNFLLLLVAVAAANGAVGLVQANISPEQLSSWGSGYARAINGEGENAVSARNFEDEKGEERNRPFGLGGDSGFGGIVGVLALPAALALLALSKQRGIRILTGILTIGVVMAIATSAARTAVLGAAIAAFAYAALTVTSRAGLRTVFGIGLAALVGYAGIALLTSDTNSGTFDRYGSISNPGKAVSTFWGYRRETLEDIAPYTVKYPLGSGFGRNGPAASYAGGPGSGLDAESEPTFLLIEVGIPGLVVMFGIFLMLFRLCVTRIRRIIDREARILLTALAAPLFAVFAIGFVGITTAGTPNAPYLWFVMGTLSFWLIGDGYQSLIRGGQLVKRTQVSPETSRMRLAGTRPA